MTLLIVRCGLPAALEVTNLSAVANELQRTYFKSKSLQKRKYLCNCMSFSCVPDPLKSAQIHENATKIALNLGEDFKEQSTRSSLGH